MSDRAVRELERKGELTLEALARQGALLGVQVKTTKYGGRGGMHPGVWEICEYTDDVIGFGLVGKRGKILKPGPGKRYRFDLTSFTLPRLMIGHLGATLLTTAGKGEDLAEVQRQRDLEARREKRKTEQAKLGKAKKGRRLLKTFYVDNDRPAVEAYTDEGLDGIRELLDEAQLKLNATELEDEGSCVIGHGITVWYARPRARIARECAVVYAPYQGSVSIMKAYRPVAEWLRSQGVECRINSGRMD